MGVGVFFYRMWKDSKVEVEVVSRESQAPSPTSLPGVQIVVEVAGAVISPGIYKFPPESRTIDAVSAAGGMAARADREWVSKNINMAKVLKDAEKIYIPSLGEMGKIAGEGVATVRGLTDINKASLTELESLPGIGPVTAKKVIDGRPYKEIEQLLTHKVVNKNVFEQIRGLIKAD